FRRACAAPPFAGAGFAGCRLVGNHVAPHSITLLRNCFPTPWNPRPRRPRGLAGSGWFGRGPAAARRVGGVRADPGGLWQPRRVGGAWGLRGGSERSVGARWRPGRFGLGPGAAAMVDGSWSAAFLEW